MVSWDAMAEAVTVRPSGGQLEATEAAEADVAAVSRRLRRSYEAGHTPKLLVLVDDTKECAKGVYYATRRAVRIGAKVVLLRVIEPPDGELGWLGVAEILQTEARHEAKELLDRHVALVQCVSATLPETVVRHGNSALEILKLIEADEDIAMLVLAASDSHKGPGPLVSELALTAGTYPVPIVIVPAHLGNEELDALS
jgi:nucleotide-binding universal stress UspA family protein